MVPTVATELSLKLQFRCNEFECACARVCACTVKNR